MAKILFSRLFRLFSATFLSSLKLSVCCMDPLMSRFVEVSRKVFSDCFLDNGALVAAPSHKEYYPLGAKDYFFVWPRDAFFVCRAARLVGLDLYEGFFDWCRQAEGFDKSGLFFEKYFVDGRKAREHFQPDQTASVLLALKDYCGDDKELINKYESFIKKCADGLCKFWQGDRFSLVSQDLWEERLCFPDMPEGFSYSVAMCAAGLDAACSLTGDETYRVVADQMRQVVLLGNPDFFSRSYGSLRDERVDASLVGLWWPAGLVSADDARLRKTVAAIEDRLFFEGGVHRYEGDEYDGWMFGDHNRKKGAGWWPLLSCWLGLWYVKAGEKDKAGRILDEVLACAGDDLLVPEQVFGNELQVAIKPLCWSHAMVLLLSDSLGLLD